MNVLKKSLLASAVTLASATAVAELSMTVGMVSDYVYRGAELGDAGAYTSIDYAAGGFYAGVWAISDGNSADGIEYDIYAGYETEIAGVGVGLGYTAYEYTYGDAAEDEISLSLSKGLDALFGSSLNFVLNALHAVNPSIPMGLIVASVPPVSIISACPCCINLKDSPIACADDAHADTVE